MWEIIVLDYSCTKVPLGYGKFSEGSTEPFSRKMMSVKRVPFSGQTVWGGQCHFVVADPKKLRKEKKWFV